MCFLMLENVLKIRIQSKCHFIIFLPEIILSKIEIIAMTSKT